MSLHAVRGSLRCPSLRYAAGTALALLFGVAAAGCGSSGSSTSTTSSTGATPSASYSLASTKACFNKLGDTAAPVKNPAISGSLGDLKVQFPEYGTSEVYIAFGKDSAEAKALENRAITLAVGHENLDRQTVLDGVRLRGNVFYYSPEGAVSVTLTKRVTACLH